MPKLLFLFLLQEVHEKTVTLHAIESESTSKESSMRHEVHNTSQMVATLKEELERRLKDLVAVREERDGLAVSISAYRLFYCFVECCCAMRYVLLY